MPVPVKVGIIACSGEEIPAGTISRLATRRVLELLRPQSTVTLCLPLFLAGEEQERRFARQHPTITVDGCEKLCAKRGTEQYSGQVAASLVVTEILGDRVTQCHRSARDFDRSDEEAVWAVAERVAAEVDALSDTPALAEVHASAPTVSCGCACGGRPAEGNLRARWQDGYGQRFTADFRSTVPVRRSSGQWARGPTPGGGTHLSRNRSP